MRTRNRSRNGVRPGAGPCSGGTRRAPRPGSRGSGLDSQALADGKIPPPPIAMLLRMADPGRARPAQFECVPDESA